MKSSTKGYAKKDDKLLSKLKGLYKELAVPMPTHYSGVAFELEEERKNHRAIAENLAGLLSGSVDLKDASVLEIGSGLGDLSLGMGKHAKKVYGIEPERKYYEICLLKKKYYGSKNVEFLTGCAEKLPFEDGSFDVVISKTVLEHVSDLERAVGEMSRVTKKGGVVYTEAPNYFWIREGHYNVYMLPLMPRFLFKFYLIALRKDPKFLDGINYITPGRVISLFRSNGLESHNIYLQKLSDMLLNRKFDMVSKASKDYKKVLRALYRLRLNGLLYHVFSKLGMYPTILLLSKKS